MHRTLGVIIGRAGSKRLPDKHLRLLGEKPLLAWTIEAAVNAANLTDVIISTDSAAMIDIARSHGVQVPFVRPDDIAGDEASALDVMRHVVDFYESKNEKYDAMVLLQPTSPFRTSQHIDEAVSLFYAAQADTVTSVCHPREHAYYQATVSSTGSFEPLFPEGYALSRNLLPTTVIENGAVYVLSWRDIQCGRFYGETIKAYLMPQSCSCDIDDIDDLRFAQYLLQQRSNAGAGSAE